MASLKELLEATKFMNEGRRTFITKAYQFAESAYEKEARHSGDSRFNHSSETAKILAELGMARRTISAGLLHAVLQDTATTSEELEGEFGKEIRFLVEAVTEIGNIHYTGDERHVESLRKFLVAMSRDIRVLIVKLAERLHTMRTLEFTPREKQGSTAIEVMEMYVPIARRLGLQRISREMEDLAFKRAHPEPYEELHAWFKKRQRENERPFEEFHKSLLKHLVEAGVRNVETDTRLKSVYSIYKKIALRKRERERIYDLLAVRIQVDTIEDCYRALGIVHASWRPLPGRIKDYIAFPKPNGYQSLHSTVFTGDGLIVEVQIRTHHMHKQAEYGLASHLAYKESERGLEDPRYAWFNQFFPPPPTSEMAQIELEKQYRIPQWLRGIINLQSFITIQTDPMNYLKSDFFQHRMFIFDKRGEVVDLPIHATPIDFAYELEGVLASHLCGVKVNGKLSRIETELKNGDIVEILTKRSAHPTEKWLPYVKTALAKQQIEQYLESMRSVHYTRKKNNAVRS